MYDDFFGGMVDPEPPSNTRNENEFPEHVESAMISSND